MQLKPFAAAICNCMRRIQLVETDSLPLSQQQYFFPKYCKGDGQTH